MKQIMVLSIVAIGLATGGKSLATFLPPEEDKVFINDGIIQRGDVYETVSVYDTPPGHTTVNMTGGIVGDLSSVDSGLYAFDSSTINISGGQVAILGATDSSTVNIDDGQVWNLRAYGSSNILVSGGEVGQFTIQDLNMYESSTLTITGGRILAGASGSEGRLRDNSTLNIDGAGVLGFWAALDRSIVNLYGGSMNALDAADNSTINVYGGNIGLGWGFNMYDSATLNVYGSDFLYDPHWLWAQDSPVWGTGWVARLTSMGFEGAPIEIIGWIPDPAQSEYVNLIPEPSTWAILTLGALAVRRKRKKTGQS